jgi:hypothetical protein
MTDPGDTVAKGARKEQGEVRDDDSRNKSTLNLYCSFPLVYNI